MLRKITDINHPLLFTMSFNEAGATMLRKIQYQGACWSLKEQSFNEAGATMLRKMESIMSNFKEGLMLQ